MNKFKTYITIALLSITLFSCANKNSWTAEKEAQFKKLFKEQLLKQDKENPFTDEEFDSMTNCIIEKLKEQNIMPNDVGNAENKSIVTKITIDCTEQL